VRDFYAHMPTHSFLFAPTHDLWPAESVNSQIPPITVLNAKGEPIPVLDKKGKPVKDGKGEPKVETIAASTWLDRNRPIHQRTWAPGEPEIIHDRLIDEGGWF